MLKLQVRDQLMMRNKIRQILWLLCCLPVLTGCIGEDDYANDPRGNFEQLWKIIDEQYCFLDTKGIDWDAVHDEYSKLIIPSMSNDDLFDILSQMLYILKDGHVNLSSASRISYYDAWYQGYPWNYREDILYNYYLGSANSGYRTSAGLKYKIFDNNIGYIRYESFSAGVGDGNHHILCGDHPQIGDGASELRVDDFAEPFVDLRLDVACVCHVSYPPYCRVPD